MHKKLPLSLVFFFLMTLAYSQTIVSTSPEDRKVVLEEFTGIKCVFCPQGHAIAQAIQNNNPGDVFLINIHVGSFAVPSPGQPDFRTPFGTAIAAQSNLAGYPAGTVNRQLFPGLGQNPNSTAMSRGQWTGAANTILADGSHVNVGVEAELNVQTREIIVHVEAYYTGNSPQSTNLLNVALLQNNTLGPQTGGNMGNNYVHQHRLVHMLTGQWGDPINTTTSTTFVDRTYTYTIPADYNGVPAELPDMEVVAFITETQQDIPSGSGAFPAFTGITNANDVSLTDIEEIIFDCATEIGPTITFENIGQDPITSLAIEYSINSGTPATFNWTGNLTTFEEETIQLPAIAYDIQETNVLTVTMPNDDDNTNNSSDLNFEGFIESSSTLTLTLTTDNNGDECRWRLRTVSGTIIDLGGPYGNNETITETFSTLEADCYIFTLLDSGGNGGTVATITDVNNTVVFETDGNFTDSLIQNFSSDGVLGVNNNEFDSVVIYPNPTNTVINIRNAESSTIQIFNILGQEMFAKSNISLEEQVEVSQYNTGTYFVKITNKDAVKTSKFIVK